MALHNITVFMHTSLCSRASEAYVIRTGLSQGASENLEILALPGAKKVD
jgi:hypothetical protein